MNITSFNFGDLPVRTHVDPDGNVWWVAKDVCECLDYSGDPGQHIRRLDDDEKGLISIQTPGGPQDVAIISESGLYSLVLGSRKPEAKAFRRWVTHEVLPSIRKTGSFSIQPPTPPQPTLPPQQTHLTLRGQPIRLYAFEHEPFLWLSWQDVLRALNIGEISIASMRIPSHQHKITAFGTRSRWIYDPDEECGVDPQFVARMIKSGSTAEAFEVRKELGEECYPAMRGSAAVRIAMALAVKNPYFTPRRFFPTTTKVSLEAPLNQSSPPQLPGHSIPKPRITATT